MSSCNDLGLAVPDKAVERQQTGRDVQHRPRRLLRSAGVHDSHTAVVSSEGEGITTRREGNALDPTSGIIQVFATDGVERKALSPRTGLRASINTLDEAGEDAGVRIGRSGCQQDGVRVPRQGCDCAANRLLEVLRDPPVVLLLEVADCNHASAGADGELLLRWRPAHEGCGTVDSEKHQGRFPSGGGLLPNVGIAVYRVDIC